MQGMLAIKMQKANHQGIEIFLIRIEVELITHGF
jgi:hypothetical protein